MSERQDFHHLLCEVNGVKISVTARIALLRLIAPRGWVAVPREPTKAMLRAAAKAMSPHHRPTQDWVSSAQKHRIRWMAMIDAAPRLENADDRQRENGKAPAALGNRSDDRGGAVARTERALTGG